MWGVSHRAGKWGRRERDALDCGSPQPLNPKLTAVCPLHRSHRPRTPTTQAAAPHDRLVCAQRALGPLALLLCQHRLHHRPADLPEEAGGCVRVAPGGLQGRAGGRGRGGALGAAAGDHGKRRRRAVRPWERMCPLLVCLRWALVLLLHACPCPCPCRLEQHHQQVPACCRMTSGPSSWARPAAPAPLWQRTP